MSIAPLQTQAAQLVNTAQQPRQASALGKAPSKAQRLEKVAQEYESFFAKMLIKSMYKSVKSANSLFSSESGVSQKVFDDMLYEQYANAISDQKVLGISTLITDHYKDAV